MKQTLLWMVIIILALQAATGFMAGGEDATPQLRQTAGKARERLTGAWDRWRAEDTTSKATSTSGEIDAVRAVSGNVLLINEKERLLVEVQIPKGCSKQLAAATNEVLQRVSSITVERGKLDAWGRRTGRVLDQAGEDITLLAARDLAAKQPACGVSYTRS